MTSSSVLPSAALICWLGAGLGLVFGFVASRSHFCTMGAIADIVGMGAWTRLRMWAGAVAVAVLATTALRASGTVALDGHVALAPRLLWLSHVVGGLCFGVGMTLAGGCGSKTLIRLGGGNLKALVVALVVAISAAMTLRGLFAVPRSRWLDSVALTLPTGQDLASLLAHASGNTPTAVLPVLGGVLAAVLAAWALRDREMRTPNALLGAVGVGAVVALGWLVTGHVGHVAEHPDTLEAAWIATNSGRAESLSFIGPHAYALQLLTLWSDANTVLTFGIATALGVIGGAAADTLLRGQWRLESFRTADDLITHLVGAVLMGFGGVTAVGCSIGQGVSGLSLLSLGALLTTASLIAGCWATLKWQESRL
jgi:uncharacterized protein